jgi:hypothetical protein
VIIMLPLCNLPWLGFEVATDVYMFQRCSSRRGDH